MHLPGALVPPGDVSAVLGVLLDAPGSSLDALRLRTRLGRDRFEAALSVCRTRRLLRLSGDGRSDPRTRAFATSLTAAAARRPDPRTDGAADRESAS